MQKEWNDNEINFLRSNYEKMSYREIGEYLGRTHSSVENKANKIGINRDRKYKFNIDFFKNPLSEHPAYWIGFIAADGGISKDYKSFGITLKRDDYEHLKKLNKDISGNIEVKFRTRKECIFAGKHVPEREQCNIVVYSTEMVRDLAQYGVVPQKSLTLKFPIIEDDDLMWAYLRGYFDGDGSIYYDKRSNQLRTKITSGSPLFRISFQEYLGKFGIKTYVSDMDCGITGKECTRIFLSKLYDNSTIYLDRKYKKYQNYKYLWPQ